MIAHINGKDIPLASEQEALGALLRRLGYEGDHFAVALNGAFISRRELDATKVTAADRIEVLAPMVGG